MSTYYGEAWTVKVFHVLYLDPIDFAKIGSWALSCLSRVLLLDAFHEISQGEILMNGEVTHHYSGVFEKAKAVTFAYVTVS